MNSGHYREVMAPSFEVLDMTTRGDFGPNLGPDQAVFKNLSREFSLIRLNGKRPIEPEWQRFCTLRREFEEIGFQDGDNAGICTGPASGLLVLDVDDVSIFTRTGREKGWRIPKTRAHLTGTEKPHLCFQYPSDARDYRNRSFKKWGFDIRGLGGQVVAPGSIHPVTGKKYKVLSDALPAPAPDWLLAFYEQSQDVPDVSSIVTWTGNIDTLPIAEETKKLILEGAPIGQRSEAIIKVVDALVYSNLSDDEIRDILLSNAIGEKCLEKGEHCDAYVRDQIAKARGFVKNRSNSSRGKIVIPEGFTAWDLQNMTLPPQKWLINGLLAEGLTLLGGPSKIGKSWMALDFATAIAAGGTVLGKLPTVKGGVLYLALEDTWKRIKERLNEIWPGFNSRELHLKTSWPRLDEDGIKRLDEWVADHPGVSLIIIDTLGKIWPLGKRRQAGRTIYHSDVDAISPLKVLADERNISIIGVHHLRKAQAEDPLDQLSGSTGIPASADTILVLYRKRGDTEARLVITGRDIQEQELALTFDSGKWTLLGAADERATTIERQDVLDVFDRAIEPMGATEVANILGKSRGSVQKLILILSQEGLLKKVGYGKYIKNSNSGNTFGSNPNIGNNLEKHLVSVEKKQILSDEVTVTKAVNF